MFSFYQFSQCKWRYSNFVSFELNVNQINTIYGAFNPCIVWSTNILSLFLHQYSDLVLRAMLFIVFLRFFSFCCLLSFAFIGLIYLIFYSSSITFVYQCMSARCVHKRRKYYQFKNQTIRIALIVIRFLNRYFEINLIFVICSFICDHHITARIFTFYLVSYG